MYRIELHSGCIDIYDESGLLIGDLELGWTDTSTGPYIDPKHELVRWERFVNDANKGSKFI